MDEQPFHLDPDRIINRTLYGTDYDPDDVGFSSLRKSVMSLTEDFLISQMNSYVGSLI